jgi:hypothetical protein
MTPCAQWLIALLVLLGTATVVNAQDATVEARTLEQSVALALLEGGVQDPVHHVEGELLP